MKKLDSESFIYGPAVKVQMSKSIGELCLARGISADDRMKSMGIEGYHSQDPVSEETIHEHLDEIDRMLNERKKLVKAKSSPFSKWITEQLKKDDVSPDYVSEPQKGNQMQKLDEEGQLKLRSILNRWHAMTLELDVAENELRELLLSQKIEVVAYVKLNSKDGCLEVTRKTVSVGNCGPTVVEIRVHSPYANSRMFFGQVGGGGGGGEIGLTQGVGRTEPPIFNHSPKPEYLVSDGKGNVDRKMVAESWAGFCQTDPPIHMVDSVAKGMAKAVEYMQNNRVVQESPKLSELPQSRHICERLPGNPAFWKGDTLDPTA